MGAPTVGVVAGMMRLFWSKQKWPLLPWRQSARLLGALSRPLERWYFGALTTFNNKGEEVNPLNRLGAEYLPDILLAGPVTGSSWDNGKARSPGIIGKYVVLGTHAETHIAHCMYVHDDVSLVVCRGSCNPRNGRRGSC